MSIWVRESLPLNDRLPESPAGFPASIQHEHGLSPVTALESFKLPNGSTLLITGEGSSIKIYQVETTLLLAECKIFDSQSVHGISVRRDHDRPHGLDVVLWGGKSYIFMSIKELQEIMLDNISSIVSREKFASDWLLDAAISPYFESKHCVFVTAHNDALLSSFEEVAGLGDLKYLPSQSQSILYSAHIVWTSNSSVMVAAGTVFGEIKVFVWDVKSSESDKSSELLYIFNGHEGSIFGVQISPEIFGADGRMYRLLASCSDDRTVRIWDISASTEGSDILSEQAAGNLPLRETGFGNNGDTFVENISAKRCIAVVMGHASRIWHVKFMMSKATDQEPFGLVNILSFGEDSKVLQWSLQNWQASMSNAKANLAQVQTFAYHTGKHIWSSAMLCNYELGSILATGGADGKVSMYGIVIQGRLGPGSRQEPQPRNMMLNRIPADLKANHPISGFQSLTLEDVLEKIPKNPDIREEVLSGSPTILAQTVAVANSHAIDTIKLKRKNKKARVNRDTLNRYAFLTIDQLLITTSSGRVLHGSVEDPHEWQELELPGKTKNDLKSYCVIAGIPEHEMVLLAAANGTIYLYRRGTNFSQLSRVEGKVAGLFQVPGSTDGLTNVLVTTLNKEEASLLCIDIDLTGSAKLSGVRTLKMPLHFVVTSAAIIHGLLILGSRSGLLAAYDPTTMDHVGLFSNEQTQTYDAITTIISIPCLKSKQTPQFLITSRDSTYSIFSVNLIHTIKGSVRKVAIVILHQGSPPFGPMIEAAWFEGPSLFLYGFRSTNFVVWNESARREVLNVECGGAHRSYAYSPLGQSGGAGYFAYTKASRLCINLQYKPSHRVLKEGGHGREIKACAVLNHKNLIATGAEDTTIRIWRYRNDCAAINKSKLECCAVIRKHTSGVQHLQWTHRTADGIRLFSASGGEEFCVWKISEIPGFGLGVVLEAVLTDLSPENDLRIMSFDVMSTKDSPQDLDLVHNPYLVNLAYSDSTIKVFWYSIAQGFRRISQGTYTSACLTQLKGFTERGLYHLMTGSSDGYLTLWDITAPIAPFSPPCESSLTPGMAMASRFQIHQSSITSLDVLRIRGTQAMVVATGGDDNALALTLFCDWVPAARILVPSAHTAAITGLQFFVEDLTGTATRLWTVSGDQKLKCWTIRFGIPNSLLNTGVSEDGSSLEDLTIQALKREDEVSSCVADAGGLVRLTSSPSKSTCLIYGNGMEVWSVENRIHDG